MPCAVAFPGHVSQVWLVLAAGALLLPISSFPVEGLLHILPGRCWRTARNSYGVRFDSPFSAQPACSAWIDAFSLAAGGCDEVTARILRIGTSVSGGFFPRREQGFVQPHSPVACVRKGFSLVCGQIAKVPGRGRQWHTSCKEGETVRDRETLPLIGKSIVLP